MDITVLPQDLKINDSSILQLYDYRSTKNISKTKINLSKNTISFLRTGTKEVIGDDKAVQIGNEHFLIMKSGNCLMTEKISDAFQSYRSILLFFSDEALLYFLEKHNQFSSKPIPKSFYIFEYDSFIQNFVSSLEQVAKLPNSVQAKLLQHKFEEIMLYLLHYHGPDFLNSLVKNMDDKISRLNNIVENNKHNKLSLEELAFLCNMSISTFKREFFKLYQNTPMKWFQEQRLEHIAFMLKTKKNRPIELYEEAGYESFSSFVQAFKKKFGTTPKQYQTQH